MRFHFPILLALGLLAGITPFTIDLYLPAIPTMARELGAPVEVAQLTVPIYLAVFALTQLLFGPISDVIGRRATVLGGLALFIPATLGCMLAPSMAWLLVARGVQALGGAAVAVAIPALVRDVFERDEYARIMSLIFLIMAIAPLVAPTVGGLILVVAGWRWIFLVLTLIALVAGLVFSRLVHETLPVERRHAFHLPGILRNYLGLLRHRAGMGYLLTAGFAFAGMMTLIVASPFVYIELYGVPERWFGVLFGVNVLGAMGCNAINARLVVRVGAERLLRLGLMGQAVACLALVGLAWVELPPFVPLLLATFAVVALNGFILGNASAGFMSYFPHLAGTASAFSGTARFGFGALAGVLVSLLHNGTAAPLAGVMAGCGLLASAVYLILCVGATDRAP